MKCVWDCRPLLPLLALHLARMQDTFRAQDQSSLSSAAAPNCTTHQKNALVPFIPHFSYFEKVCGSILQEFHEVAAAAQGLKADTGPRPWCQFVTSALPASHSLKPSGNFTVNHEEQGNTVPILQFADY